MSNEHYSLRHWRFVIESLADLNESLAKFNTSIQLYYNEVKPVFTQIFKNYTIVNVFSTEESGLYITYNRDILFAKFCKQNNITWNEYQNCGVVRGLKNRDTWRKAWYGYMNSVIDKPNFSNAEFVTTQNVQEFNAELPENFKYNKNHYMQIGGRTEGLKWMSSFFDERLKFYSKYISKPELARYGCSRLSPYFAWGNISIREVYQKCVTLKKTSEHKRQLNAFMSRLRWQAHFIQKFEMEPRIEFEAFNKGYLDIEQPYNETFVNAWKDGKTGYPLVDASIRAVKETGYLNFRMRSMSVSFLVHHLFQHFSTGSEWLARQFLDFEPGIHYGQFQMQAGFTATNTIRIYNPTKNAIDHDAEAIYIKKYVPELRDLPIEFAIEPWKLTVMEEKLYNFELGIDYPERIIDIKDTRKIALEKLYAKRKEPLTQSEKERILKVHTLKRRFP